MSWSADLLVAGIAFGISVAGLFVLLPVLRRHALDMPNARSSHTSPTPRGGGLAVVVAILVAVVIGDRTPDGHTLLVMGGVVAIAALGLADDLTGLTEHVRFAVQVVVSAAIAIILVSGTDAVGLALVGAAAVAAAWLCAFTNAFNFMDGIDGLSALVAGVAAGWYLWVAHQFDLPTVAILSAALLGAVAGFLPVNYPAAKIFLGDTGSYGVGLMLGCLALLCVVGGVPLLQSLAPLLVYVADTGWTLLVRILRRERWWTAHREHVYQRLTDVGADPRLVALGVGALSALVCLSAAWAPLGAGALVSGLLLAAYLVSPAVTARMLR